VSCIPFLVCYIQFFFRSSLSTILKNISKLSQLPKEEVVVESQKTIFSIALIIKLQVLRTVFQLMAPACSFGACALELSRFCCATSPEPLRTVGTHFLNIFSARSRVAAFLIVSRIVSIAQRVFSLLGDLNRLWKRNFCLFRRRKRENDDERTHSSLARVRHDVPS